MFLIQHVDLIPRVQSYLVPKRAVVAGNTLYTCSMNVIYSVCASYIHSLLVSCVCMCVGAVSLLSWDYVQPGASKIKHINTYISNGEGLTSLCTNTFCYGVSVMFQEIYHHHDDSCDFPIALLGLCQRTL